MQIHRKRAVITGAGSGLGRELCMQLARRSVALAVADIRSERAEETLSLAGKIQGADTQRSFAITCDVGSASAIERMAEEVGRRWSGLDILINNAGIAAAGRVEEISDADWQRMLNINLSGAIRACRVFVPMLRAQGSGHIVNVASFAGLACAPGMASYNVAKAGVVALSESLRGELAPAGIGVSVACPAFFASHLLDSLHGHRKIKGQIEKLMRRSTVQAVDVGRDIIDAIENNRFMVISHPDARRGYLFKRLMPERFFKAMLRRSGDIAGKQDRS